MNEYFSFEYEANDNVDSGREKSDNKNTVSVSVYDERRINCRNVVNKFQEFMIKTGRFPEFFDFGDQTLYEIIAEWHEKHDNVKLAEDAPKEEKLNTICSAVGISDIKHEDLENAFDKMCEVFQQIMENKKI